MVAMGEKDAKNYLEMDTQHAMHFFALKRKKDPLVFGMKFEDFVELKETGEIPEWNHLEDEYLRNIYLQ